MKSNQSKSQVPRHGRPRWNDKLAGESLKASQCQKDLGILIQNTLLFDIHARYNEGAVYALLATIRIAFRYLIGNMFNKTCTYVSSET